MNHVVKQMIEASVHVTEEKINPFKHLTREEIVEQLAIARKNAEEGQVMEAHKASDNIRAKYGL